MGKNGRSIGKYRKFRGIWRSMNSGGIGELLVARGVGSSMGGIWKKWGSVMGCKGKCGKRCWEGVEECMGLNMDGVGKSKGIPHNILHHPTLTRHLSPHFPTLTQHFSPTLHWHLSPHFPTLTLHLPCTHLRFPTPPSTHLANISSHFLQHFPILPHTYFIIYSIPKFLIFPIYCKISLAIK